MGMFKQLPTPDILKEKQAIIAQLSREADDAVDLVNRTISRMELINQQYDDAISEIDAYVADLNEARNTMSQRRSNNTAIIANFSKLLEVGTDDTEQ